MNNENEDYDFVNHPPHYRQFSIEVIEMMNRIWGSEHTAIYCEMNAFKYKLRAGDKPGSSAVQDYNKAAWYLNEAKELREINNSYNPLLTSTGNAEDERLKQRLK